MFFPDLSFFIHWWALFAVIGILFLPLTTLIFSDFLDKGYIFSKILGIAFLSYTVFLLGVLKILPFTSHTILFVLICFSILNILLISKYPNILVRIKSSWHRFLIEECIFLSALFFWSLIRSYQPNIQGLEKFMDFGFVNSILRSEYFPPKDMWFTPFAINYYYFGHLVTAMLTKLSAIPSNITYNLMLATLFALTFSAAFSIGANLTSFYKKGGVMIGGFLTAFILTFAGNIHTIYAFFKAYLVENPVPFWQLLFSPTTFPNSYWYPNATRFIQNTIHEFPLYSFVVSDLHGHVLDIPFVLLTLATLLSLFLKTENLKLKILLISFLLAVMYMTNAWDGIIYFLLTALIVLYIIFKQKGLKIRSWIIYLTILSAGLFIFSLPFNLHFKPFASGIGILCAPDFLIKIGHLSPFIFEPKHCQNSPLWQLFILYGFFYFWVISFIIILFKENKSDHSNFIRNLKLKIENLPISDIFVLILIILSTLLIILPEFIYIKDIYPAHYRANTMFKLVYQSFIMLSISSGYIIIRILNVKNPISKMQIKNKIFNFYYMYLLFAILFFILVMIYPYFAINSYYGNLKTYHGLDGTKYLKDLYPADYEAIVFLQKNIKGQPVILEAQGDSYTDYGRVSANTGLPTVLGWVVHEWLWRGSYDIPAPRINDVKTLYETSDLATTKHLIKQYNVSLIFLGDLERQKYPNLNEEKFKTLGKIIYQKGNSKIFQINY